jgi:5-dehydro-2-deoxygluconokinase
MADLAGLSTLDVLTIGRVGIDLYPLQDGVTLDCVDTFQRYLGGSPTNVAVAAARLGHSSAVITRTGDDPFAKFVHTELRRLGVRDDFVAEVPDTKNTLAFCEIFPPDHFPLYYFRTSTAPDMFIRAEELDLESIAGAGVYWATLSGLSADPSREAHYAAWRARNRRRLTVLDLDYRPSFWASPEEAKAEGRKALEQVTIVVGNLHECGVLVGESDPERAADALLAAGIELAIVKMGPAGVLAKTRTESAIAPPLRIEVVNGLGAGDGFGGALCHGLLSGLGLGEMLRFANAAGAIVASRRGCSTAMPTRTEIEAFLRAQPPT